MENADWNIEDLLNESQSDSNVVEDTPVDRDEDFILDADEEVEDGADVSDVDVKPRRSTRQAVPKVPSTHEFIGSPDMIEDEADDWKPPKRKKRRKAPVSLATRRRRNAAKRRLEPNKPSGMGTGLKRGRPRRRPLTPANHTEGEFDVFDEDKTPSPPLRPPLEPPEPIKPRKSGRRKASRSPPQLSALPVISTTSLRPRKPTAPAKMRYVPAISDEKDLTLAETQEPSTSQQLFELYPGEPSGILFDPVELFGDNSATNLDDFLLPVNAHNDDDFVKVMEIKTEAEFEEHEVSPTARFHRRPSQSSDEVYDPSNDEKKCDLQLGCESSKKGCGVNEAEDLKKFYEDLGLSDEMDAEVAAITGGKLFPIPMNDSVKTDKPVEKVEVQLEKVEVQLEKDDSDTSDTTQFEVTFRKLNIGGDTVEIPNVMLDNQRIFNSVLSVDVFNSLSDESKAHLQRFLPSGVNPEQGVADALTPDSSFFFGSPLELAQMRINEGFYDHDYPQHQAMLRDDRRVRYDHFIRQHHMKLLKKLLLTRHAILEQAATIPPDAPIKINPMKYANLKSIKREKEVRERSKIRADMLINAAVGPSSSSSTGSCDEQPYEPPIPQYAEGRSIHYSNSYGEHDLDTYQPHKVRSIKEMLQSYKKLRLKNPRCPSLDISDITLEKVYERSGLSFQSERNFAQNPYPPPTTTATKRNRKRKMQIESEAEGDSAPGSPTPNVPHA